MIEISWSLKALARELQVPVLALSQLSRSVELHQSKQPMLSDLWESGSLEQDVDIVMFLYREDYYKGTDDSPSHITELIVAKHRRIDSIQQSQCFFLYKTRFRNTGLTAKPPLMSGIKNVITNKL